MFNKKEEYDYFEAFEKSAQVSLECAKLVKATIESYKKEKMEQVLEKIHKVENNGDEIEHEIINRLAKEFLPPIEREDIVYLAHKIDDLTDLIEEILINTYIFSFDKYREDTVNLADVLVRCCETEIEILKEFKNFRKSKDIKAKIIKLNELETEGDELYKKCMKALYDEQKDAIQIIKWTEIYKGLEDCIDLCEEISMGIENIVLKNS